jgi:hypothetical protein
MEKLQNIEFVSMISKYELICLCECWIQPDDQIDLQGYDKYVFPRKIKGGGIVIFYKSFFFKS